jgi:hypothetical protein
MPSKKKKVNKVPTFQQEFDRIMGLLSDAACSMGMMREALEDPDGTMFKRLKKEQRNKLCDLDYELDVAIGHIEEVQYGHLEIPKFLQNKVM